MSLYLNFRIKLQSNIDNKLLFLLYLYICLALLIHLFENKCCIKLNTWVCYSFQKDNELAVYLFLCSWNYKLNRNQCECKTYLQLKPFRISEYPEPLYLVPKLSSQNDSKSLEPLTKNRRFYHPNQFSTRCVVYSFNSWLTVPLCVVVHTHWLNLPIKIQHVWTWSQKTRKLSPVCNASTDITNYLLDTNPKRNDLLNAMNSTFSAKEVMRTDLWRKFDFIDWFNKANQQTNK